MSDADTWIDALRLAHDDIAGVARAADDEGLARRSGASEWDVAQVLGHLGSQSEIAVGYTTAALEDRPAPGQDANPAIWARWDALDNRAKAEGFLEWSERSVALFEGMDAATRDRLRIDNGFMPDVDVATTVSFRLNELTLHGWDVHVATAPDATLLPTSVDLLIDRSGALIQYLGHADALAQPAHLEVITFEPGRHLGLLIDGSVALGDAPDEGQGSITLAAESWLRLLAGRLTEGHTPDTVVIASDTVGLDDLRKVFPGY